MNFLEGRMSGQEMQSAVRLTNGTLVPLGRNPGLADGAPVTLGIRPEHVAIRPATGGVEATVELVEPTGLGIILHLTVHGVAFKVFTADRAMLVPGERLTVGFPPERLHLFGPDGARIPLHAEPLAA